MPALDSPQRRDLNAQLLTQKLAAARSAAATAGRDASAVSARLGMAACFTLDQDIVRQKRFKILHDDRDYCRDAYDRAR